MKANRLLSAALFLLLCLTLPAPAPAEETVLVLTKAEVLDAGAERLFLHFNVGGAKLTLQPSENEEEIVRATVTTSDPDLEPSLVKQAQGKAYEAMFNSGHLADYPPGTVHEWVVALGRYALDTDLLFNLGGVSAQIDLGGAPLRTLSLDLGGDLVEVAFSTPTSRALDLIMANCGGASLGMYNLGNSDVKLLQVSSGGAQTLLTFTGAFSEGLHQVLLETAGSSLRTLFPQDTGQHVNVLTTAALVSTQGNDWVTLKRRPFRKVFVTEGYDEAPVQIAVDATAVGSAMTFVREETPPP